MFLLVSFKTLLGCSEPNLPALSAGLPPTLVDATWHLFNTFANPTNADVHKSGDVIYVKGITIDVNDIIDMIREDRMALVQNTAQYKFAYQALLDYGVNTDLHVYAWEESLGDSARRLVAEETMKRDGRWTVTYEGGQMLKRYNESAPKVTTNPDVIPVNKS